MRLTQSTVLCSLLAALTFFAASARENRGPKDSGGPAVGPGPAPVAWGFPLRGGGIRLLCIAPRHTLRDAEELAQRLELKLETVPLWTASQAGYDPLPPEQPIPGTATAETLDRLRALLDREYGVIALGNFDPAMLPTEVLERIFAKVRTGTGLILAHLPSPPPASLQAFLDTLTPDDPDAWVKRGIGESATPEWALGLHFVKTFVCEAGRVVQLDYIGDPPATHFLLPALTEGAQAQPEFADTYFSLVAKAVCWAAQREPSVWVDRIEDTGPTGPAESEIPPDLPEEFVQAMRDAGVRVPYRTFRVVLSGPVERNCRVRWQLRDPGFSGIFPHALETVLKKGEEAAEVRVFAGAGRHGLDVWLLDKKGVIDWFSDTVTIEGWPDFGEAQYSKSVLLPNDSLTVSINIRPIFHQPRTCTVYARAFDTLGRLVAETYQPVPAEGGPVRAQLNFVDLLTNRVNVEVYAVDSSQPPFTPFALARSARAGKSLPVRLPYVRGAFSLVAESPNAVEYNARALNRTLSDLGVDTAYIQGSREAGFHLTEAGLRPLPSLASGLGILPKNLGQDAQATSARAAADLASRQTEAKRLQDAAKALWGAGSVLYSLGDRRDLFVTPEEFPQAVGLLTGFRIWLQEKYEDLAALNAAWGTEYGSWDAVVPLSATASKEAARYAPWMDQRRYLDAAAAELATFSRAAIRAVDGDALVGCTIGERRNSSFILHPSSLRIGQDAQATLLSQLVPVLDLLSVPSEAPFVERLRAYQPPGAFTGVTAGGNGGTPPKEMYRWLPWYAVLHGLPSAWLGNAFGTRDADSSGFLLEPLGHPSPGLEAAATEAARIRAGISAVLLRASRVASGIALYDSPGSVYLGEVDHTFDGSPIRSESAFIHAFQDLGYSVDFVSEAAITRGGLRNYRLLVLPMTHALSRKECEAIREFVDQGGHVLADLLPGRYDEHGRPYEQPPLAGLFGVLGEKRKEEGGKINSSFILHPSSLPNPEGAGTALFLNHTLVYPAEDSPDQDAALRLLVHAALSQTTVERSVDLYSQGGVFPGEALRFRYGDADVIAVLRRPMEGRAPSRPPLHGGRAAEKARLRLDGDGTVYDMLQGVPLRNAKDIRVRLAPGEAALFARLPYEVMDLLLIAPPTAVAGRRLPLRMTVRTRGALAGEHVVHVELIPLGRAPLRHYARNVICPKGEGETYLPLARNEVPGLYRVTARDVLSGAAASALVKIQSGH